MSCDDGGSGDGGGSNNNINNNKNKNNKGECLSAEEQNIKMSEERNFLTNLMESAQQGNGKKVQKLVKEYSLNHGINVGDVICQFKDGRKRTAFHFACASSRNCEEDGEEDIVSILTSSKWLPSTTTVDTLIRMKDKEGLTPLMIAAQLEENPILSKRRISLLLDKGGGTHKLALARSNAGATALHYAAAAGAGRSILELLYQAGKVALKTSSFRGGTPLHWAAGSNADRTETMTVLIDLGANVNALDNNNNGKNGKQGGLSPLVISAAAGIDANAKLLVQRGADRSIILPGNVTVFHMAADLNLVGTLSALLQPPADDSAFSSSQLENYLLMKNDKGETPLDLAAKEGHVGCVMLLLPHGKNTEADAKAYILAQKEKQQQQQQPQQKPISSEEKKEDNTQQTSPQQNNTTTTDTCVYENDDIRNEDEAAAKLRAMDIIKANKEDDDDDETQQQKTAAAKEQALVAKQEGNQHFAKKQWNEAIKYYTKAIKLNPTDATFYSNRSACLMMLQQHKNALDDAIISRHLRHNWPKSHYRVAIARLALGRYEDAAMAAWGGLQLDQENDELKSLLQKCVHMGKKEYHEKFRKE